MMRAPLPRIRRRSVVGEGVILSQPMSSDNHRGQPSHLGNIVRLRATTLDRGRSSWAIIPAGSIVSHVFPLSPFLCWPDRNTCVDLPPAGWHSELSSNRIQHLKVFPSTDICSVQPRNAFWGKKDHGKHGENIQSGFFNCSSKFSEPKLKTSCSKPGHPIQEFVFM